MPSTRPASRMACDSASVTSTNSVGRLVTTTIALWATIERAASRPPRPFAGARRDSILAAAGMAALPGVMARRAPEDVVPEQPDFLLEPAVVLSGSSDARRVKNGPGQRCS